MERVSPLGKEGNLYLHIWFESRWEVRKGKESQLQMVLAVEEEEAAPPVAGEHWGKTWGTEKGVGKGGMGHLCHKVPLSEPSTSFPGDRKAERGRCCCPLSGKPIIHTVLCGRSGHHWGFTCAGKCAASCTRKIRDVSFLAVQRQSSSDPSPKAMWQGVHSSVWSCWKFYLQM